MAKVIYFNEVEYQLAKLVDFLLLKEAVQNLPRGITRERLYAVRQFREVNPRPELLKTKK